MRLCHICGHSVEHPYLIKVISENERLFFHRDCFNKQEGHHEPRKYPVRPPLVTEWTGHDQ